MSDTASRAAELAAALKSEIRKAFVGSDAVIDLLVAGFFGGLHILIEDIPGVGKTTLARSLARAAGLDFGRIQFTPDLLPGDITGVTIWSQEARSFVFRPGAIMHQFVLADEVNRASSRTQAALLEAMQEMAVTVDGATYPLPTPFTVVATQNPLTFTGTFPLPEAQIDRFGLSLSLGYPGQADELEIIDRFHLERPYDRIEPACAAEELADIRRLVRGVRVDEKIRLFLISVAERTRRHPYVRLGMSPRATGHLLRASQARAVIDGRGFVVPEDVMNVAVATLRHRIVVTAEARMESRSAELIVDEIMRQIEKPAGY
ncbi:AAA family ATPase [Salinispira pacifica]